MKEPEVGKFCILWDKPEVKIIAVLQEKATLAFGDENIEFFMANGRTYMNCVVLPEAFDSYIKFIENETRTDKEVRGKRV